MNESIYRISLDVHETHSQIILKVKRDDTARKIYIGLTDGGRLYKISANCSARLRAKKPNGQIIFNDCTIADNVITYELTKATSDTIGVVDCEITLYGADSRQITSSRFSLLVEDVIVSDDEIEGTNEFTALVKYTTMLEEKVANGDFKGEKGDKGDKGEQGIQGEKGDKGEKGDSYVLTDDDKKEIAESVLIVDNLESKDTDKALSANQGRLLNEEIGDIESALDIIIAMQEALIEGTASTDIVLLDATTGTPYKLYVDSGEVMLGEGE